MASVNANSAVGTEPAAPAPPSGLRTVRAIRPSAKTET